MGNMFNPCSEASRPENVENMRKKAKEASVMKCKDPDEKEKGYVNIITILEKNVASSAYKIASTAMPKIVTMSIDFYFKLISDLTSDGDAGLRQIKSTIDAYDDNLRRSLIKSVMETNNDLKSVSSLAVKKSLLNVLLQQCLTFGGFLVAKRSLFVEAVAFAKIINAVFVELIEISETDAERDDWKVVWRKHLPEYRQNIYDMIDLLVEDRLKFIYHDPNFDSDMPVLPGPWQDHFVGSVYRDEVDDMIVYKEAVKNDFRQILIDCYNTIPITCFD